MNTLKFILRLNATSCLVFGTLFVLNPDLVSNFLGQAPSALVLAIGIILVGNGVHLIVASRRREIFAREIIWFSLGDFSWWLASLFLITADLWITTRAGIATTVLVAVVVATLGAAQLWVLGLMKQDHIVKTHLVACARSWLALPDWVKVWLVVLNGIFLMAFLILPSRIGEVTITAYFATAPLLAGQVGYDGGLRRILALSHLVAWLPLLTWLVFFAEQTPYSVSLAIVVSICLALDINDVRLFLKGDRSVWGSSLSKG